MSLTLLLVFVVVASFAIGHLLAQYAQRYVALSGAEYLLVGVLIGPQVGPHLLTVDSLMLLSPFVSLLLGLVGFMLGLRAPRALAQVRYAATGLLAGGGVLALVGGATMLVAIGAIPEPDKTPLLARELVQRGSWALDLYITHEQLWLGVALGAAASVASPFVVESTSKMLGSRGPVSSMLAVAATTTEVVAVLAAGVVEAAARATNAATQLGLGVGRWAAAAAGVGVACGLLFSLFIGRERDTPRIFLASLGAVIFASGIGAAVGISPLFVNLIAGATVALTSPLAGRLREEMDRLQHAAFVLVMIFAGALWAPTEGRLWLLPVAYLLVRFAARRVLTRIATRLWTSTPAHASRLGNGLMSQGTLAVALGLDFAQRFPELSSAVLTTVLIGTLASDLWSIRALRSVLLDAGEVAETTGAADAAGGAQT